MTEKITYERLAKKLEELPSLEDMSNEDKKLYCEVGETLLSNQLKLMIKHREWALGIIMAASMLDFVGKVRLIWESKGEISQKNIMKYNFDKTIKLLSKFKIIDDSEHEKLKGIKDIRNKLAHDLIFQHSTFQDKELNPDLENVIRDAIALVKCLLSQP